MGRSPLFQRIFHVNICVRNMERSLEFYRGQLGMQLVEGPFTAEGPELARAFGMESEPNVKVRGAFLRWGDDANATVLDLVEFIEPKPTGEPYPTLNNIGLCRIAFKVDDCEQVYADLASKGVEFMSPPVTGFRPDLRYCCFYDPDGTILELLESP